MAWEHRENPRNKCWEGQHSLFGMCMVRILALVAKLGKWLPNRLFLILGSKHLLVSFFFSFLFFWVRMSQNDMNCYNWTLLRKKAPQSWVLYVSERLREGHFGHWFCYGYKFQIQLPARDTTKRINLENRNSEEFCTFLSSQGPRNISAHYILYALLPYYFIPWATEW